ncbi:hypothetical protein CI41S_78980 [Bradyrhizobium ivorense]|nr:hypothetical protein CI41S_78980 [Bradyrhizobium ivorense]
MNERSRARNESPRRVGQAEIAAAWWKRTEEADLLLALLTLTPHSTHRSTRTCSTTKVTKDHPSRMAAARMVEAVASSLAGSNRRVSASKHSQARPGRAANKTRRGKRSPHAKPATAMRSAKARASASRWPSVGRFRIPSMSGSPLPIPICVAGEKLGLFSRRAEYGLLEPLGRQAQTRTIPEDQPDTT